VGRILSFGALSAELGTTLPGCHWSYILGVNRASQDVEFGMLFDLYVGLWPELWMCKVGNFEIRQKSDWNFGIWGTFTWARDDLARILLVLSL
jgi:hypothetical protein